MSPKTEIAVRSLVSRDPEVMGGAPVFAGTRVPVETLVDYLQGGYSLGDFLDNFPSVTRDQALSALELLRQALLRP
jgi:uncharacterized protein (DUF433 family)